MDGTKHLELLALEAKFMEIAPTALQEAKTAYMIWCELSASQMYNVAEAYHQKAVTILTAVSGQSYTTTNALQTLWDAQYKEKHK